MYTSDFEDHSWRDLYEDGFPPGEALFDFFEHTGYTSHYPDMFSKYLEVREIS
jgi:hypothetical protein